MANHPAEALELRDGDQQQLVAMTRSPTVQAGLAQRARILLLASEGLSNTEIADKVGVSRPTVLVWRQRYGERGLDGLVDRTRPGRAPHAPAADVLAATLRVPPRRLGVTHWSSRVLGDELGVGRGTVVRAWRTYGVQPVRGGYRFAVAPVLSGQVVSVLALRVGPPESLVVLDLREPARAADRAGEPLPPGALADLAATWGRHVPAARETGEGDPAASLLGFLDEVNRARAAWPTASRLHLVSDGRGPVSLPALREALAVRSRISVHTVREPGRWSGVVAAALAMAAHASGPDAGGSSVVDAFTDLQARLGPHDEVEWVHRPRRRTVK
jgi:transposase